MLASEDKYIEAAAADLQAARQRVQSDQCGDVCFGPEQGKRLMISQRKVQDPQRYPNEDAASRPPQLGNPAPRIFGVPRVRPR